MISSLKSNLKLARHHITRFVTNNRTRKHIITRFTDKIGMIYFGTVNQHSDEHQVIKGFTVSQSHRDDHFSVGTTGGYNISLVDRSDVIWDKDNSISAHSWMIMSFELHSKQSMPHIFINACNHSNKPYHNLFTIFPALQPINLGTFEDYSPEFINRFTIYSTASDSIETERLFPNNVAMVMATHLWPFSIEIHDGFLYIYSNDNKATSHLLGTMLENGLWLAAHLDRQVELV